MWIARYSCGCAEDAKRKRDLLNYCGRHGGDRQELIKVPSKKERQKIRKAFKEIEKK